MHYVAHEGQVEASFAEIDLLQISRQKIVAVFHVVPLQVLTCRLKHSRKILGRDARLRVCLRNGDAPDARPASDINHLHASLCSPCSERLGGASRRLTISHMQAAHQRWEELLSRLLRFEAMRWLPCSYHLRQMTPRLE